MMLLIMKLRNTLLLVGACLVLSSTSMAEAKRDVRSYDYGRYQVDEYRDRGRVDRVEVRPSRGRGYTLRDKGNQMPSARSQDQRDQNMDFPTIQLRRW